MNAELLRNRSRYVGSIRSNADLLSAVVRTGSLDAPVDACPGWTVRDLVVHLGDVHRWATHAVLHAARSEEDHAPGPDDDLAVWIVDGAAALIDALEATAPDAPTWHPFVLEQRAWVWGRRQALETAVHRWDGQDAVGTAEPIDARLAPDGIHEYFELAVPRVLQREQLDAPAASLHVHCTDVDGEWLVWGGDGGYRMLPIHDRGVARSLVRSAARADGAPRSHRGRDRR